jgi:hypothetical protein
MVDRYGESQATIDDLILEEPCGRQASNVRGRGIQSYTYLVSTNQNTSWSVEGARRLYGRTVLTPHRDSCLEAMRGKVSAAIRVSC